MTTVIVPAVSVTGVVVFAVLVSLVPAAIATQDRAADGLRADSWPGCQHHRAPAGSYPPRRATSASR